MPAPYFRAAAALPGAPGRRTGEGREQRHGSARPNRWSSPSTDSPRVLVAGPVRWRRRGPRRAHREGRPPRTGNDPHGQVRGAPGRGSQAAEGAFVPPESPDEEDSEDEDSALAGLSLLEEPVSAELLELDVLSVR